MQTNNRLIALFCLGILLGAALTILVGRYTHTLYLASDYEPLLKEMEESLEMQKTLTEEQINNTLGAFEAKVKKENRGGNKFDSAQNIRKLAEDYLTQHQNQVSTPQQLKQLYQQMFAKVEKVSIPAITETMPFLHTLTDNTLNNTAVSNKMPQNVKLLYSKLQQLQIKVLETTLVDYWFSRLGEICRLGVFREPILMPNATTLHQGDTLKLSIGFLCNNPSFVVAVDDKKIFGGMDGLARITRPCDKVGEHIMKGTITHLTGFGEKTTYPFTQRYTVVKPCR